jgi:hypothetical protein
VNVVPWYFNVCFSVPFFFLGVIVGVVVADIRGVQRPLVALAGAVGATAGEWFGLLELPRLANSPWVNASIGGFFGSCALSVLVAWLMKGR